MYTRDFTFDKYKELCKAIKNSGYKTYPMKDFFINSAKQDLEKENIIIMRHDIDNKIDHPYAIEMAKFEKSIGIFSTYYFRTVPNVFNEKVITEISELGHEIGYHYEALNESKGDYSKALDIFKFNLNKMREIYPVMTIAQHGGSLGDLTATTFFDFIKTGFFLLLKKKQNQVL